MEARAIRARCGAVCSVAALLLGPYLPGAASAQVTLGECKAELAICSPQASDTDRDGRPDVVDTCPDTSADSSVMARHYLENTDATLAFLTDVLVRLRELFIAVDIEAADGRFAIQAEVELLFDMLLGIANTSPGGDFLFGGSVTGMAPFAKVGDFDPFGGVPTVRFDGSHEPLYTQLPDSTVIQITISGDALFFGDEDGDGLFPDGDRVHIFDVVIDFRNWLFDSFSHAAPSEVLFQLDKALEQVTLERDQIAVSLSLVSGREPVDDAGCSIDQFCGQIDVRDRRGFHICVRSDWKNDEPLRRRPRDCKVVRDPNQRPRFLCVAR